MPIFLRRAPLALLAAAGLAAVPVTAAVAAPGRSARETLSNFKITGTSVVRHGKVTFTVRNTAPGVAHELVVIRTTRRAADLPMAGGGASEKGKVGKVVVAAGKTGKLRLSLKKGHYALICNFGDHYMMGMSKDLTVR